MRWNSLQKPAGRVQKVERQEEKEYRRDHGSKGLAHLAALEALRAALAALLAHETTAEGGQAVKQFPYQNHARNEGSMVNLPGTEATLTTAALFLLRLVLLGGVFRLSVLIGRL